MTGALGVEMKDEAEEPVDLIPTLIPLPPDEVCISAIYHPCRCSIAKVVLCSVVSVCGCICLFVCQFDNS